MCGFFSIIVMDFTYKSYNYYMANYRGLNILESSIFFRELQVIGIKCNICFYDYFKQSETKMEKHRFS